MEGLCKDYDNGFDCSAYLNTFYSDPKLDSRRLTNVHKFWTQNAHDKDIKMLEFGGGPIVSLNISACPHVHSIVFAEYAEHLRGAVKAWLNKDPAAFNWRPTFDYVVQELEGKGAEEAAEREEILRRKIRAVVPCDIRAENVLHIPASLEAEYGPPYDVVLSCQCLEAAVVSEQEYKSAVTNLARLIKPGGYLVMVCVTGETFYTVGSKRFSSFTLSKELVVQSVGEAGGEILLMDMRSSDTEVNDMPFSDKDDEVFLYARF